MVELSAVAKKGSLEEFTFQYFIGNIALGLHWQFVPRVWTAATLIIRGFHFHAEGRAA